MTNNDILRRVRYILNAKDAKIVEIFGLAEHKVTVEQVSAWLKKDDDPAYVECSDEELIFFLDGFIIEKRGKKDGPAVKYIQKMSNNLILMKLKIAFNLKAEDILQIMALGDFKISKHELSALFRKRDHKHFRVCKNQILRKFLKGVQIKYRGQPKSQLVTSKNETEIKSRPAAKTFSRVGAKQAEIKKVSNSKEKPKTISKAASVWKKNK